ncbi:hypothetical protein ON010_g11977 [Phytophthora cinnamomi]|nr:hypothetical protein ON010_g11977 [Phytophthora cinnamomi]
MAEENGAEEAVRSFYHHIPTQEMWCDLDHQRVATQWSVHDRIKLCDRCSFIVRERPENEKKKFVRYRCVDYSARGPNSLLTGVATGAIVFAHELTGGLTGVLFQPAKGLIYGGVVGAVKGAVAGVYYLLWRPVHGAVLFADRAAAGRKNAKREEGHRKLNSVFDRHMMAAFGVQNGLADTFCLAMSPNAVDIVIFARRKDRKKMLRRMKNSVKHRYCARYEAIVQAQNCPSHYIVGVDTGEFCIDKGDEPPSSELSAKPAITLYSARLTSAGTVKMALGVPSESSNAVDFSIIAEWEAYASCQRGRVEYGEQMQDNPKLTRRSKSANSLKSPNSKIPSMNVCLAGIGTWNNGVKQFVAIGIKLKEQGHRVRVAANERFRTEIMTRGLEFYPLAGAPESIQDFAKFVYDSQNAARAAVPGRLGTGAIQTFKELMYSLWPAAYGSDPHGGGTNMPGEHFRADALLWHPLLLGHVHVAERLGIPLQCVSLEPLSPTYYFPHPLSSITGLDSTIMTICQSNLLTYGIVDTALWHGSVAEVLTQFRAFIGLKKRCDLPDPLVRWEVPHIYLWNPTLLPKPLDWGAEFSVVGHVTLGSNAGLNRKKRKKREKERKRFKWPSALTEFAFQMPTPPVIYFGVSTRTMSPGMLKELLRKVDAAASEQQVRIVFQTREVGDRERALYQSENVLEIASDLPYARIFQEQAVAGVIHWGESDIIAESLSAGKPIGICGVHSYQHFVARLCEQAHVGLPLIDWKTCTAESLSSSFLCLLKTDIRDKAQSLAATFDPEKPICDAVQAFYANLPWETMWCDVDPSKLARVFDPSNNLKLSLQAYVAIRDKIKVFVPYKPLRYGGNHPPTFSIRGNPEESQRDAKPIRQHDGVPQALKLLEIQGNALGGRSLSCSSVLSNPGSLVATPEQIEMFWSSVEEETAVRRATNVAYERLVKKPHRKSKREAVMRFFGFRKTAQCRDAEQLTCVE